MSPKVKARIEQIKQARQIHGGMANMCAAAMGVRLSKLPIPSRKFRERVYRTIYGKKYASLREEELEKPLAEYRSLNELFTRGVRSEFRPLSTSREHLLCPCDGTVQEVGSLDRDTLLTAKGISYTLDSLLPGIDTQPYRNGRFAIIFLSPADCHRVFSPQRAQLREIIHVPGRRLLVHPPYQRKEFPVFSLNERVIMTLEAEIGSCLLVMVAGWGVGNITYPFATQFQSLTRHPLVSMARRRRKIRPNRRVRMSRRKITRARLETPLQFERGQWLATFELGSTVILITPPREGALTLIAQGEKIHYGQPAYAFRLDSNHAEQEP